MLFETNLIAPSSVCAVTTSDTVSVSTFPTTLPVFLFVTKPLILVVTLNCDSPSAFFPMNFASYTSMLYFASVFIFFILPNVFALEEVIRRSLADADAPFINP